MLLSAIAKHLLVFLELLEAHKFMIESFDSPFGGHLKFKSGIIWLGYYYQLSVGMSYHHCRYHPVFSINIVWVAGLVHALCHVWSKDRHAWWEQLLTTFEAVSVDMNSNSLEFKQTEFSCCSWWRRKIFSASLKIIKLNKKN